MSGLRNEYRGACVCAPAADCARHFIEGEGAA